jgi:hypothetical protein
MVLNVSNATQHKEATVPSKKQLTLKQAEAQLSSNEQGYKDYVKAQTEKKDAKTKAAEAKAQKKMDSLRGKYTAYRNAYRAFLAQGGSRRKPAAKKSGSKSASKGTAKSNKGSQKKNGGPVTETKLSAAAMERRTKDNPMGLTEAQLEAEANGAPLEQPIGEVISSS